MKKIRKMDEMELMNALKVSRVCHVVLFIALCICDTLQSYDVFPKLNNLYLSILVIIHAITFIVSTLIYEPRKIKEKYEK